MPPEVIENKIYVSHITIRLSIFFLLLKLVFIEVLASLLLIAYFSAVHSATFSTSFRDTLLSVSSIYAVLIVIAQLGFSIFIVVQWINEYYEINPKEVLHKRGLIFKKSERYPLNHIRAIEMRQGFIGRLFNYGTIKLYDWDLSKFKILYLIHNPHRYQKILEGLLPKADKEEQVFRQHWFDPDEEQQ